MPKLSKEEQARAKLEDIETDEVSLVPKGANRFPFLLVKRQTPVDKSDPVNPGVDVPILEVGNEEERLVTGVVLIPEKEDGQGDILTEEAVRKAAHGFMAKMQQPDNSARLGVMHKDFSIPLEFVESSLMLADFTVNNREIKKGSWVVTMRVVDDDTWQKVKKGEIRGFSLKGSGRGWCL